MVTALLIFFPLAAALLMLLIGGENAKRAAFGLSLIELAISLFAWTKLGKAADLADRKSVV